jgi:ubiquinone/menaquinone biosynthesis C-methylase UbiE
MGAQSPSEEPNPVVEEYSRLAEHYDTRWSFYVEATTRETIARLSIRPTDRVLDVGCGTGALLYQMYLAYPQARLAGVDPVLAMLQVARRRLPSEVELREGWADRLPYADGTFDVVASCNMFHYIPAPMAALSEMTRVLRPGGELVITDWCDDYLACRICDWYLRCFSRAHVKVYRERDCLQLLQAAGHSLAVVERYKISWLWGLMTARASKLALEPAQQHAAAA